VTKPHSIPWQSPYCLEAFIGFPITFGSMAKASDTSILRRLLIAILSIAILMPCHGIRTVTVRCRGFNGSPRRWQLRRRKEILNLSAKFWNPAIRRFNILEIVA
jgi:hypothetical protein